MGRGGGNSSLSRFTNEEKERTTDHRYETFFENKQVRYSSKKNPPRIEW